MSYFFYFFGTNLFISHYLFLLRKISLSLLRHIRHGTTPTITNEEQDHVLRGLTEFLQLRRISTKSRQNIDGVEIPLTFSLEGREVWVDIHHSLVDPALSPSKVAILANKSFQELVELDTFTLTHDLPTAVAQLQLPEGWVQ